MLPASPRDEDEDELDDDPTSYGEAVAPLQREVHPCVVVLSGRNAGRLVRISRPGVTIGRSRYAHLRVEDDGVSREHARLTLDEQGEVWITDLGSKNGTYVGERLLEGRHKLSDGERIRLGSVVLLKFGIQDEVEQQVLSELYLSATRDALTGLHNRGAFMERLNQEFATHRRSGQPLTVLFFDIDHFKRVNDTYGHLAGDAVLRQLADLCLSRFRTDDMVARYGGEEFVVLLRGVPRDQGLSIAEWLRAAVERTAFTYEGVTIPVSLSVGVVSRAGTELDDPVALLDEADRMLYDAKKAGRNRVVAGV